MLAQVDELARIAEDGPPPDTDVLRVGVLGFGLADRWPQMCELVAAQHPRLRLAYVDTDWDSQYDAVRSGEVDVSIAHDIGPTDGLAFDPVLDVGRYAVVPRRSALADAEWLTEADVAGEQWVKPVGRHPGLADWAGVAGATGGTSTLVRTPGMIPAAVALSGQLGIHGAPGAVVLPAPGRLLRADGGRPRDRVRREPGERPQARRRGVPPRRPRDRRAGSQPNRHMNRPPGAAIVGSRVPHPQRDRRPSVPDHADGLLPPPEVELLRPRRRGHPRGPAPRRLRRGVRRRRAGDDRRPGRQRHRRAHRRPPLVRPPRGPDLLVPALPGLPPRRHRRAPRAQPDDGRRGCRFRGGVRRHLEQRGGHRAGRARHDAPGPAVGRGQRGEPRAR